MKRSRPRTCTGCREESPKRELIRVVRTPDGQILVDVTGRHPGRGAYVCRKKECVLEAMKRNALARALKVPVERKFYETLLHMISEEPEGGNS
ncbi:MAG: YlxR family protein [Synergistaceae bacterium]|nr:YlxR family protein [Synergistaceae bacterium]